MDHEYDIMMINYMYKKQKTLTNHPYTSKSKGIVQSSSPNEELVQLMVMISL